jgi:hypothetical protein
MEYIKPSFSSKKFTKLEDPFSSVGKAFTDIGDQKIEAKKRIADEKLNNIKMDYYDTQNKNAKTENSLRLQKQANEQRDKVMAKAKADREYASKVKTAREYFKASGVDTSKYSDDDVYYNAEMIESTHTDPTDFKYSRSYQMKNGKIVAEYKNKKGELQHKVIFDAGEDEGSTAKDQAKIDLAKTKKRLEDKKTEKLNNGDGTYNASKNMKKTPPAFLKKAKFKPEFDVKL